MAGEKPKYFYPALDDAITLYMRRRGISQEELAAEMHMAPNTFSWKRRGIRDFTLSETKRLCDILGIDVGDAVVAQ